MSYLVLIDGSIIFWGINTRPAGCQTSGVIVSDKQPAPLTIHTALLSVHIQICLRVYARKVLTLYVCTHEVLTLPVYNHDVFTLCVCPDNVFTLPVYQRRTHTSCVPRSTHTSCVPKEYSHFLCTREYSHFLCTKGVLTLPTQVHKT